MYVLYQSSIDFKEFKEHYYGDYVSVLNCLFLITSLKYNTVKFI